MNQGTFESREQMIRLMDGYHKENLEKAKIKYIQEGNSDFSMLVVGEKGSGKSTFASQSNWHWNPRYKPSRNLAYNSSRFWKILKEFPVKDSIFMDEAVLQVFSRKAMSRENITTVQLFDIIRVKQHLLTLCVPKLKRIDWDIIEQMSCIVFIDKRRTDSNGRRIWKWYLPHTFYSLYQKVAKERMSQNQAFDEVMPFRAGYFDKRMPFEEEYDEFKNMGVDNFIDANQTDYNVDDVFKNKSLRNSVWVILHKYYGMNPSEIAENWQPKMSVRTIQRILYHNDKDDNITATN